MNIVEYEGQKELTLDGNEIMLIHVPQEFIIVTNLSDDTVYVSKDENISARLDSKEVIAVEPGRAECNANAWAQSNHCFLLGSGRIRVEFSSDECYAMYKAMMITSSSLNSRNLLDNPDFRINQRGQDTYTGTSTYTYTVDRWCIWKYNCDSYGTVLINNDGSLSVDGMADADDAILTQVIANGEELIGKTVTLSLEVTEIYGSISVHQHGSASAVLKISSPGVHKLTFKWDNTANHRIVINNTNCTHYTLKWIKLEKGSEMTPFNAPDLAAELLKCQRYFQVHSSGSIPTADLRPVMRAMPGVSTMSDGNYAYSADL